MEKETLEEAAYQARRDYQDEFGKDGMNECIMFDAMKIQKGFQLGAKWQAERMYSEEEVLNILHLYSNHFEIYTTPKFSNNMFFDMFFEWFKQFKKK